MQLVRPGVTLYDPPSGDARFAGYRPERIINAFEVLAKFGVEPAMVPEVQALAGDSTDGIPGVPKVGLKTAAGLIREFGSAEAVIACIPQISRPKLRDAIASSIDAIRLAHQLVTLLDDVPVPVGIDHLAVPTLDPTTLIHFFDRMEFRSMAARVRQHFSLEAAA
jgi:DNA polymerase-1